MIKASTKQKPSILSYSFRPGRGAGRGAERADLPADISNNSI